MSNSYFFSQPDVKDDSRDVYWEFSPLEQKMKDNRGSVNFWYDQCISLSITAWQVDWNKTFNAIFCMKDRPWYAMLSLSHSIPLPCTFSKLIFHGLRFITLLCLHLLHSILKEKKTQQTKTNQINQTHKLISFLLKMKLNPKSVFSRVFQKKIGKLQ